MHGHINPSRLLQLCTHPASTTHPLPPRQRCVAISQNTTNLTAAVTEIFTPCFPRSPDNVTQTTRVMRYVTAGRSKIDILMAIEITKTICQEHDNKPLRFVIVSDNITTLMPAIDTAIEKNIAIDIWTWDVSLDNMIDLVRGCNMHNLKNYRHRFVSYDPVTKPYWCILFKKDIESENRFNPCFKARLESDYGHREADEYHHTIGLRRRRSLNLLFHETKTELFLAFTSEKYRDFFQAWLKHGKVEWANILKANSVTLYDYLPKALDEPKEFTE